MLPLSRFMAQLSTRLNGCSNFCFILLELYKIANNNNFFEARYFNSFSASMRSLNLSSRRVIWLLGINLLLLKLFETVFSPLTVE